MNLEEIKTKFREYKKSDIIITDHAKLQAFIRDVDLEEVKNNINNPEKLVYARKQEAKEQTQQKYDCYFAYSKHLYHRYVVVINRKLLIVTIIKISRDWQKSIN